MPAGWIESHGLWAVLLGGMLEGETVMVAAGYALSQGYLPVVPTYALAVLGASLGDHAFYLLGRLGGQELIRRIPVLRRLRAHAVLLLRKWGRGAAFFTRFAYGLRTVLPMSMGVARYPSLLFLVFNLLGSAVFAAFYLSLGYLFGEALEELFGRLSGMEFRILLGLAVLGGLIWLVREWHLLRSRPPRPPH